MGGLQGGIYGGGVEGMCEGIFIAAFSGAAGAAVGAGIGAALGEKTAATLGGKLLTAGGAGFAGGFTGGAMSAGFNGQNAWKGGLVGGAMGAGSAMAMVGVAYGVSKGAAALKKREMFKDGNGKYGKYENASMEQKMEFVEQANYKKLDKIRTKGKSVNILNESSEALPSGYKFSDGGKVVYTDADGISEEAWGFTNISKDRSTIDIILATRAPSGEAPYSWGDLYYTSRHEMQHAFYFTYRSYLPQGLHHTFMGGNDRYSIRTWNYFIGKYNSYDPLLH